MKICRHKNYEKLGISTVAQIQIANMGNLDLPVKIVREVCWCKDCLCLFIDPRKEKYVRTDKGRSNDQD